MKLREIGGDLAKLIISTEQAIPRSPGIHVSDVIDYLKKTIGKQGQWQEDSLEISAQLGRVWETVVARLLADAAGKTGRFTRPGEVERDGIIGSPDGIDFDDEAIIEYKCTWRSSRNRIETDFPYYWWQVKAYCYMTGCSVARLYVLFINGDCKGKGPSLGKGPWEARFTPTELKANWDMILKASKELK